MSAHGSSWRYEIEREDLQLMCGRYVAPEMADLSREFRAHFNREIAHLLASQPAPEVRNFNVAPTQGVPVVRVIRDGEDRRESVMMRWGLIPFWAHGQALKSSTINATVERIDNAPMWRDAWNRGQRCIMPAIGFYEWHVNEDGSKTPFFIQPADGSMFNFAAVWDRSIAHNDVAIHSCALITLPANELMAHIHNVKQRMPAAIDREEIDIWLSGTREQAKACLKPWASDTAIAWPVSTGVNSPRNNHPQLMQPIDTAPAGSST
jgi:putative SOS response-associated peptidase YedK